MFCASYKNTHPEQYIEYECPEPSTLTNGSVSNYKIKWNNIEGEYTDELNIDDLEKNNYSGIYCQTNSATEITNNSMWLVAPCSYNNTPLMYIADNYIGYDNPSNTSSGLRPIVCLKSEVRFKEVAGGFEIISPNS